MVDTSVETRKTSIQRFIAGSWFAACTGWIAGVVWNYIPEELEKIWNAGKANGGIEIPVIVNVCIAFMVFPCLAAITGAYLARRRGVIIGICGSVPYTILFLQQVPFRPQTALMAGALIVASAFGGYIGEAIYSSDSDLDLPNESLTLFGIRWFHYIWIFPLVMPFYTFGAIGMIYLFAITSFAAIHVAIHPSLWLSIGWVLFPIFIYLVEILAVKILVKGFMNFHAAMLYRPDIKQGWMRAGKALLYGIAAPVFANALAWYGSTATHRMLASIKPSAGDWKIWPIILAVPLIAVAYALIAKSRKHLEAPQSDQ